MKKQKKQMPLCKLETNGTIQKKFKISLEYLKELHNPKKHKDSVDMLKHLITTSHQLKMVLTSTTRFLRQDLML